MKTLKCDLCGKEFDEFDKQENFGLHYSNVGYGSKFDGTSIDVNMCCDCFDKIMDEYIVPRIKRQILEGNWDYDMRRCPLDTKVYLLSADDFWFCPQQIFVGAITRNGLFRTKGRCYQGDPDLFYRSEIIAWQPYNEF